LSLTKRSAKGRSFAEVSYYLYDMLGKRFEAGALAAFVQDDETARAPVGLLNGCF